MDVFVLLLWNPIIFFEFVNLLYVLEKINFNFKISISIFKILHHICLLQYVLV